MNIAMIGFILIQSGKEIKKTWILLDACYTDSVTNNLDYVEDINNCVKEKDLAVFLNGGLLLFNNKGRCTF